MHDVVDIARDSLHQRAVPLVHLLVNIDHVLLCLANPLHQRLVLLLELLPCYLLLVVVSIRTSKFSRILII